MMAESLESRKFDRKPQFDVPLPMRSSKTRDTAKPEEIDNNPANMMAFSLLTKRGNRQQVRNHSCCIKLRTDNARPGLLSFLPIRHLPSR